MSDPVAMAEVWRGDFLECLHMGHAVVCDASGDIVQSWGDPDAIILPRSSCKMIQALPLIETGAADAFGLNSEHLALACASHIGAAIHTDRVARWLQDLDLGDSDLRCGPQLPADIPARNGLIRQHSTPCQIHNNCSGKHSGFLTVTKHIGAGPEYVDHQHPLQLMIRDAFEEITELQSPGFGIDGCSAPNFATSVHGLARSMAFFANASANNTTRGNAASRLLQAMLAHPELIAGENADCTRLMRAMNGKVAVKTGAEGVYVAILPDKKLGVAVKITDGAKRGAVCAIAAILAHLGVLDTRSGSGQDWINLPQINRAGLVAGYIRPPDQFPG